MAVNMSNALASREAGLGRDLRAHETYDRDTRNYERDHAAWETRRDAFITWVTGSSPEAVQFRAWQAAGSTGAPPVTPPVPHPGREPREPGEPVGVREDMKAQRDAAAQLSGVLKPREGDAGAAEDFMTVYGRVGEFGDPRLKARMEDIGRNWDGSGSDKDKAAQAEYGKIKKSMEGWDGKDGTRAGVYEGIGMAAPTADETAALNDQTAAINAREGLRKAEDEEGGPGIYSKYVKPGRDEVSGWVGFGKDTFDAVKGIYDAFSTAEVPDDINKDNRDKSRAAQDERTKRIADAAHDKDGFRMKPLEHTEPTRNLAEGIPGFGGQTPHEGPYTARRSGQTQQAQAEEDRLAADGARARAEKLKARRDARAERSKPQQYGGHNFA